MPLVNGAGPFRAEVDRKRLSEIRIEGWMNRKEESRRGYRTETGRASKEYQTGNPKIKKKSLNIVATTINDD